MLDLKYRGQFPINTFMLTLYLMQIISYCKLSYSIFYHMYLWNLLKGLFYSSMHKNQVSKVLKTAKHCIKLLLEND